MGHLDQYLKETPIDPTYVKGDTQSAIDAITRNPDYQFRLSQGLQGVENSAAANGMLDSGNAMKELTQFGQGMASSSYQDRIKNLSGLISQGANAAAGQSQQAQSQGQDVAGMRTNLGNTLGSGEMAKGNALAQGLITSKRWDILQQAQDQQASNSMIGAGFGLLGNIAGMAGGGMGGGM